MEDKTKILFFGANPSDSTRLNLDEELSLIKNQIRIATYREEFLFIHQPAVRVNDFLNVLIMERPHIVHFSGHATRSGIVFMGDDDKGYVVDEYKLMDVFSLLKNHLKCVLLNACYTAEQALAISQVVPCVIGCTDEIEDRLAREFSAGFYLGICNGYDVGHSVQIGQERIKLNSSIELRSIHLHHSEDIDPIDIKFIYEPSISFEEYEPSRDVTALVVILLDKLPSDVSPEEAHRFVLAVKELLKLSTKDIRQKGRRDGSVYLYIELPASKAEELIDLVKTGELAGFGAIQAEITSDIGEETASERVFHFLPKFTILGLLQIVEEHELSDKSIITICKNPANQYYFARSSIEEENHITYLAAVSRQRYEYIRSGAIEVRDVFMSPENGNVFKIIASMFPEEHIRFESLSPILQNDSILPLLGEYIQLETHTLPLISDSALSKAVDTNREVFSLKFEFKDIFRTEAPVKLLGNILSSFQETVDVLADSVRADAKPYGKIPDFVKSQTQMMVTSIGAGSFHVEMASEYSEQLHETMAPVSFAVRKLITLLRKGVAASDLRSELISMPARSSNKYQELLRNFSNERIEITNIEWASPEDQTFGEIRFTSAQAAEMVKNIKKIDKLYTRTVFARGRLVAINKRTDTFEFQSGKEEDILYRGGIIEDWDRKWDFDKSYVAVIKQTRYLNRNPKNILVGLYDIGFMDWLFGNGDDE